MPNLIAAFATFAVAACIAFAARTAPAHKQIEIRSMRAMWFDTTTGVIDRKSNLFVLSASNLRKYNFPADVEHRTHFEMTMGSPVTYVEVEILIDAAVPVLDDTIVELRAARPRQAAQTQRVHLAEFNAMSTPRVVRVPFFVYDEGCDTLVVTARIFSDASRTTSKRKQFRSIAGTELGPHPRECGQGHGGGGMTDRF